MKKIIGSFVLGYLMFGLPSAFAKPEAADELNELLRGEVSAVETYHQAMKTVSAPELTQALKHHEDAVSTLQEQIRKVGGTPVQSSGVWGTWASAVTGAAKVISRDAALKALKEGEEHGVKEYEEKLKDDDVPAEAKNIIQERFLPAQKAHIASLDAIMARN